MSEFKENVKIYGVLVLISFLQGLLIRRYDVILFKDLTVIKIVWVLVALILSSELTILIHELGHLVMGRFTGYQFLMFRYRSFLIKHDSQGKLRWYRQSIVGTAGQCLMVPPNRSDKPVYLYNAGGVIFNLIFVFGLLLLMALISIQNFMIASFLWIFLNIHLLFAFVNWIDSKGVINDGANHRALKQYPKTVEALYTLLQVNGDMTSGVALSSYVFDHDYSYYGTETTVQRNVLAYYVEQALYNLEFETALEMLKYAQNDDINMVDSLLTLTHYQVLLFMDVDKAKDYEKAHKKQMKQARTISDKMYSGHLLKLTESLMIDHLWDETASNKYLESIVSDPVLGISMASKNVYDWLLDFAIENGIMET